MSHPTTYHVSQLESHRSNPGDSYPYRRRVTFVTSFFNQPKGGLGRYENELVKGFEHLPEVTLEVAQLDPWQLPPYLTRPVTRLGYDLQTAIARHLPLLPKGGGLYHLSHQLLGLTISYQRLHDWRRGRRTPIVVTVHDLFPEVALHDPSLRDIAPAWNPHQRWLYRRHLEGIRQADAVIAISEATARDVHTYLRVPRERLRVIYQGFDDFGARRPPLSLEERSALQTKWQLDPEERTVLYVGSQDGRKNLPTLIAAVGALRAQGDRVVLLIVGSPRVGRSELVSSSEVASDAAVRFTGHVDDYELAALYKLADAFAFPSRFEGFGLPPLEAMAYGCPVIASRASAIPEVVGDAALLVPPTDVYAWVAGLQRVFLDAPLKQALIGKGYLRAAKFPWRQTATETARVYEELLSGKGVRYASA